MTFWYITENDFDLQSVKNEYEDISLPGEKVDLLAAWNETVKIFLTFSFVTPLGAFYTGTVKR